jgi:hypothetical protein
MSSLRIARVLCALVLLSTIGCSFVFVESPPSDVRKLPPSEPVSCTTSKAAPLIDLAVAGFQAVRTGLAVSQKDSDYKDFPISRKADIGIGATMTTAFAASMLYGFLTTSACTDAKELQAWRREEERLSKPEPAAAPPAPPVEAPSSNVPSEKGVVRVPVPPPVSPDDGGAPAE